MWCGTCNLKAEDRPSSRCECAFQDEGWFSGASAAGSLETSEGVDAPPSAGPPPPDTGPPIKILTETFFHFLRREKKKGKRERGKKKGAVTIKTRVLRR